MVIVVRDPNTEEFLHYQVDIDFYPVNLTETQVKDNFSGTFKPFVYLAARYVQNLQNYFRCTIII